MKRLIGSFFPFEKIDQLSLTKQFISKQALL